MSKIKIVTDSTSDIPKEIAKEYDISVIALNVFFGDEKFKDRITITTSEFYGMCDSGIYEWPTTSQPSAREFVELYENIFKEGYDSIISIHISPKLSGTQNSVQLAINKMPGKDIIMVNGNTVSLPLGLIALVAAKLNKEGKSKDEIVKALNEDIIPNSHIVGVIESLEYLHKGGRIGKAKKILGTLLKKFPLIQITDGLVDSFGSTKNLDEGFEGLMKMAPKVCDILEYDTLWVGYTSNQELANKVESAIRKLPNAPKNILQADIGPAVGTHIGPNVMALTWIGDWNEEWFFNK